MKKKNQKIIFFYSAVFIMQKTKTSSDQVDLSIPIFAQDWLIQLLHVFYVLFTHIKFCYFRTGVTFSAFKTVRTIDVQPDTNRTFSKDQRIRYDDNHGRRAWLFHSGERCTPINRGRYEFRNLLDCRNCLITFR